MPTHPLDRQVGLARIGRAEDGLQVGVHAPKIVSRPEKRNLFRSSGPPFASPQADGAGGIRNLTLTSFLHNPRHLPSGVRGGGTKRREGWAALYQVSDIGVGSGSGAAALALDSGLYRIPGARPAFGYKAGGLRARAGAF